MSYSVGIWIVGSLLWQESAARTRWRAERLDPSRSIRTTAPIRYGRCSQGRANTYTMVFSEALTHRPDQLGRAVVIPCRHAVSDGQELLAEAEALWAAERDEATGNGRISANWGCVALTINSNTDEGARRFAEEWKERIAKEKGYGGLERAEDESAVVGEDGLLRLPWPLREDGSPVDVDLLLATATCPTLLDGQYATPAQIACAWIKSPAQANYFWRNREHGIETFQDSEIEGLLREAGHGRMTPLERNRLVTALTTNGFHAEVPVAGDWVAADATFAPGRCFASMAGQDEYLVGTSLQVVADALAREGFERVVGNAGPAGAAALFRAKGNAALHVLVRRLYQLSRSLPTAPLEVYREQTKGLPTSTEAERTVIQRVGQDIFRDALMEYWSGKCAATGIDQPELLRASHCKPWSKSTDAERLDVHNGFLFVADVDAAFDKGLITFDDEGLVVLSPNLTATARARFERLAIVSSQLLTATHRRYLAWHRTHEFLTGEAK